MDEIGAKVSDEEWAIRRELAIAYRMFHHWGWDDLIYTHLSARVPGPDHHFLLNPFDLGFEEVTPANLIKVDRDGEAVLPTEHTANPAGFVIHSAVHLGRHDAHCVLHLHTPDGQAVASMADGLLALNQTSMFVHGFGIGYHDYESVATDLDERERLVRDLGQNGILILRNHGTLAVGSSVGEAFTRMYYLERACQVQVRAMAGGAKLNEPPLGTAEATAAVGAAGLTTANVELAWPMIIRRAQRLFPELAN